MLLKPGHYLPPLAALVLVAGWQIWQRRETATLTREMAEGREKIAALKQQQDLAEGSAAATGRISPDAALERIRAIDTAKINWKQVAMAFANKPDPHGMTEMEAERLRMQCFLWSADQLNAALDQIAKTPDLTDQERQSLNSQLLAALASRDPAALARPDRDPKAGIANYYVYRLALTRLAEKDPAAASAWLDRTLADREGDAPGVYDKGAMQASLIAGLLLSDEGEAIRRMGTYPEESRQSILRDIRPSPEQAPAYLKLLRENLPPNQVPGALAESVSSALWSGTEPVTRLLERLSPTLEERRAIAEKMTDYPFGSVGNIREVTEQEVAGLHDWFALQAPGSENELAGKSLGKLVENGSDDLDRIAAMVTKYDANGSSGMLIPFLEKLPAGVSGDVTALIDRIADPAKREQIRTRFEK